MDVSTDAEVYLTYRHDLLRYATSLVGPSQSEDLVSTVIVRTIQRRPLAGLDNPRAYLLKAVLNEARSVWRRKRTDPLPDSLVGDLPGEVVETLDVVWRLPLQQRAAVYFFYWEGNSVAETAQLMGVRPGTVKRYLYNARKRLESDLK